MIRCMSCGAETSNGLALCELCQRRAEDALAYLPVYFRNLARWKPGRSERRRVPQSGGPQIEGDMTIDEATALLSGLNRGPRNPDSTGDKIRDRLAEAQAMLTTWARALTDDRPHLSRPLTHADAVLTADLPDVEAERLNDHPAELVALLCTGFARHLTSLSTLDWCGEFVHDLARHETVLRRLTESSIPGWYAGACRACGNPTYAVPGLSWTTCNGIIGWTDTDTPKPIRCGAVAHAADRLDVVLTEARDWTARPKPLAEALVALIDTEQSVPRLYDRIRQWGAREAIPVVRRTQRAHAFDLATETFIVVDEPIGPSRYRLGDVLDRITAEGATRVDRVAGCG